MRRSVSQWVGLSGAAALLPALGLAQVAPAAAPAAWHDGAIEVSLSDSTWSQPIAFRLLASTPSMATRFQASTVTVQERMRPDGPVRRAKATFRGITWLQWGTGKVPLFFEDMSYSLIAAPANNSGTQYHWSSANPPRTMAATANRIQAIRTPKATWCTWFTVQGAEPSAPQAADGPTPSIRWMLWRRPAGAACK